ncbi:hypothetical protein CKO12_02890 [Chromatium okenii]|nr:hypothetical protein [Chromatium okenii]
MVLLACLALGGCAIGRSHLFSEAKAVQPAPSLRSASGCLLRYQRYQAASAVPGELVVIAPGFRREQTHFRELARHLAAAGLETVTVESCNQRLWTGAHQRQARDLQLVATALGARRVIYVGHSAGGLAALLAGRADPRTVGVVTLDLVDAEQLGIPAAQHLTVPLVALSGEPSPCNAQNNGLAVVAANPRAQLERIAGANHCDFEAPTDWRCRLLCVPAPASTAALEQAARQVRIIQLTTAALQSLRSRAPPD